MRATVFAMTPFRQRKGPMLACCLLLLLVFGCIDYFTGYEMGFFVFYALPVGLAAWHLGRGPGILIALASSLTWWCADRLAGQRYSSNFMLGWNSAVHFSSFIINAITIAKIKASLDQRHQLKKDLAQTQRELERTAALLALCPACHKPHEPAALQRKTAAYLNGQPAAPGDDARCESCRANGSPASLPASSHGQP